MNFQRWEPFSGSSGSNDKDNVNNVNNENSDDNHDNISYNKNLFACYSLIYPNILRFSNSTAFTRSCLHKDKIPFLS